MQVINDKALLLKVRNPKQITAVIPKSKELSMNEVVVNWGLDEAHTLRSLNIIKAINSSCPLSAYFDDLPVL